jgi:hypothetical protein
LQSFAATKGRGDPATVSWVEISAGCRKEISPWFRRNKPDVAIGHFTGSDNGGFGDLNRC